MGTGTIEISVKGKWVTVPALHINGKSVVVTGRWIRVAVVNAEEWLESEVGDPEACITILKGPTSHALKADIFTFRQKLPAVEPKYQYPLSWDSVAAIRLTTFANWWEYTLPQETRKNARRALKRGVGATVERLDDDLIGGIVQVNNDSSLRQGRRFDHYGKTFDEVKKDQSTYLERCDFICAYFGDELIGFMKLVYCGSIATILQFLTKNSHYDKRPSTALIVKAVEVCLQKGVSYLVYGNYVYGNKKTSSLLEFKRRHGFEEVLLPRFHIPLTIKGKVAMALGLHRGLVGVMPDGVMGLGLKVRAYYYKLKQWRAGVAQF